MKMKTILVLLILTLSIYASNINVQIIAEENNCRPTPLELTPYDPIFITSDSGLEVFPGSGTSEDPYVIEGYNITTTDISGIYITYTTKYFVIRNCYVDAKYSGICIGNVADGTTSVINNTCNNNDWGIRIQSSVSSTVANNTFTNCGLYISEDTIEAYLLYTVENNWVNGKKLGFYTNLDSMIVAEPIYGQLILVNCTNVTVRDQILNSATNGLFLYSCTYSVIINNTCNNNSFRGIVLFSSVSSTVSNNICSNNNDLGIFLYFSVSSTVSNNTCSNNNYGIYLHSSDFCFVTYNLLQGNEGYGIYLFSRSDNLIHHNTFIENNLGGTSQACDDGANNTWHDSTTHEGNYWSDWSGTGSYSLDGSAGSEDLYPLNEPAEYSTDENQLNFTFTLIMLVFPLILTRTISKKAKKE